MTLQGKVVYTGVCTLVGLHLRDAYIVGCNCAGSVAGQLCWPCPGCDSPVAVNPPTGPPWPAMLTWVQIWPHLFPKPPSRQPCLWVEHSVGQYGTAECSFGRPPHFCTDFVQEPGGKYFDWLAGGVDHSLPGNGGPTCSSFRRYLHIILKQLESERFQSGFEVKYLCAICLSMLRCRLSVKKIIYILNIYSTEFLYFFPFSSTRWICETVLFTAFSLAIAWWASNR